MNSAGFLLSTLNLAFLLVVMPAYASDRGISYHYHCRVVQKTILTAMEIYSLDHGKTLTVFDDRVLNTLLDDAYLKERPVHYGDCKDPAKCFVMLENGNLFCLEHGFLQPPEGCDWHDSAYKQLLAAGCTDQSILKRASRKSPNYSPPTLLDFAGDVLLITIILVPLFSLFYSWHLGEWLSGQRTLAIFCLFVPFIVGLRDPPMRSNSSDFGLWLSLTLWTVLLGRLLYFCGRVLLDGKITSRFHGSPLNATDWDPEVLSDRLDCVLKERELWLKSRDFLNITLLLVSISVVIAQIRTSYIPYRHAHVLLILFLLTILAGALSSVPPLSDPMLRKGGKAGRFALWKHVPAMIALGVISSLLLVLQFTLLVFTPGMLPARAGLYLMFFFCFFSSRTLTMSLLLNRYARELDKLLLAHKKGGKKPDTLNTTNVEAAVPQAGERVLLDKVRLSLKASTCPVCGQGFVEGSRVSICRKCSTPHHQDCWRFSEGCATFACSSRKKRETYVASRLQ